MSWWSADLSALIKAKKLIKKGNEYQAALA